MACFLQSESGMYTRNSGTRSRAVKCTHSRERRCLPTVRRARAFAYHVVAATRPRGRSWNSCVLCSYQAGIDAVQRHELLVPSLLHDDAAVDDCDLVGVPDGAQPVGDRDRRPPLLLHDLVDRRLHHPLARRVERRRRLVEQQDRRLLDDGARDGDALLLAARQLAAAQAHLGVVAVAEALDDEVVRVRRARRGLHLLAGRLVLAKRDVLRDGAHEEHRLLPD
mmetsp:Transcript_11059/g.36307  ORF Transcript_11059/g.36307 Transcript_11059/m.36307 type:complete len:223 (+) Transcript_11059:39-707(+)